VGTRLCCNSHCSGRTRYISTTFDQALADAQHGGDVAVSRPFLLHDAPSSAYSISTVMLVSVIVLLCFLSFLLHIRPRV
jgi:hypothetical protein